MLYRIIDEDEIFVLTDEDDNTQEYDILGEYEEGDTTYYLLSQIDDDDFMMVLKRIGNRSELSTVDDEDEYSRIADIFDLC